MSDQRLVIRFSRRGRPDSFSPTTFTCNVCDVAIGQTDSWHLCRDATFVAYDLITALDNGLTLKPGKRYEFEIDE